MTTLCNADYVMVWAGQSGLVIICLFFTGKVKSLRLMIVVPKFIK